MTRAARAGLAAAGLLGAGLAGCALLEGLLRLSGAQPPFLYELREDVCATHIPGLRATVSGPLAPLDVAFNRAGYRDVEREVGKRDGVLRVALLGDSFVEALQVPYEETAGRVLEDELRRRLAPRDVEVLNFGVAGFGTTCSYLTLRHRALAYDPDLVVLAFYVGNDVYDNHRGLAVEPNSAFFEPEPDGSLRLRPIEVRDNAVKRWLRARSRLFLFVRDRLKRVAGVRRMGERLGLMQKAGNPDDERQRLAERHVHSIYLRSPSPLVAEAWSVTDGILALMVEETRARGVPLLVAVVPTVEQLDAAAAERYRAGLPGVARAQLDFALPERRLREMLAGRGVPALFLRETFHARDLEPDLLYFRVDGHWTALGNRVAGETLAAAVEPVLRRTAAGETRRAG